MKSSEKRMAGDYEIIQSVYVGDKEVVFGENPADISGGKYLCSLCQHSDLGALHQDLFTSDNYLEVMKIFGERIVQQAEKARQELSAAEARGISIASLSAADCTPFLRRITWREKSLSSKRGFSAGNTGRRPIS